MALTRQQRLVILVFLGVVPPSAAIVLLNQTITATTAPAIQAAIAGGIIAAVGTVASAIYKEVSAYFQQTTSNVETKVQAITPLVQKYYNPWINSAQILGAHLHRLSGKAAVATGDIESLLYYIMVFYGYRMKFLLDGGGFIMLSSSEEGDAVNKLYQAAEMALDWEGTATHEDVSYLQWLFITHGAPHGSTSDATAPKASPTPQAGDAKTDDQTKSSAAQSTPYMFYEFNRDVQRARGQTPKDPSLSEIADSLTKWWTDDRGKLETAARAVDAFATGFRRGIDELFTAWGN